MSTIRQYGNFAQSCLLPARIVDERWLRSLFCFLDSDARAAVYSLAFSICFVPTHGVTSETAENDTDALNELRAARELFDLLDDCICNRHSFSTQELAASRSFSDEEFVASVKSYYSSLRQRVAPLLNRCELAVPSTAIRWHNKHATAAASTKGTAVDAYPESGDTDAAASPTVTEAIDNFARLYIRKCCGVDVNVEREMTPSIVAHIADWCLDDLREIHAVLRQINTYAAECGELGMRVPVDMRNSDTVSSLDLTALETAIGRIESLTSTLELGRNTNAEVACRRIVTIVFAILCSPVTAANDDSGDVRGNGDDDDDNASLDRHWRAVCAKRTPMSRRYTHLEAYEAYVALVYRYRSFETMLSRWSAQHANYRARVNAVHGRDIVESDSAIRCVVLPMYGVWQSGSSHILWIVLHTIAALIVQSGNLHVQRLLTLLQYLSFYILCIDCKMHWRLAMGDQYFELLSRHDRVELQRLPIDLVLLRCHNTVHANTQYGEKRGRTLSLWTLSNLCIDYREFAARCLLGRGDPRQLTAYRWSVCAPLYDTISAVTVQLREPHPSSSSSSSRDVTKRRIWTLDYTVTDETTPTTTARRRDDSCCSEEDVTRLTEILSPLEEPLGMPQSTRDVVRLSLREQYGQHLYRVLWRQVDPRTNASIPVMW